MLLCRAVASEGAGGLSPPDLADQLTLPPSTRYPPPPPPPGILDLATALLWCLQKFQLPPLQADLKFSQIPI